MRALFLISISWTLALFFVGCSAANQPTDVNRLDKYTNKSKQVKDNYVINSRVGSINGMFIGMTEAQIQKSGRPYKVRYVNLEGDDYKVYELFLPNNIVLTCTLDLGNILHKIESSSVVIRDEYGRGVGSTLTELKSSYPRGRFIKGIAEGRHANFLTGTRLIFHFNPDDLDQVCFEEGTNCMPNENIVVNTLSIGKYSPK